MKYKHYLTISFKNALEHRATLLIWLITKPLGMLVFVVVWTTLFNYAGAEMLGEFTLEQIINYNIFLILTGAVIWAGVDDALGDKILNGDLTSVLTRPINYALSSFYSMIGWHISDLLIQVIPAIFIAMIFFGFKQAGFIYTLVAIVSVAFAFLINYWFSFTWGLMYFKAKHFHTLHWLKEFSTSFLSGTYIPLTFFPLIFRQFFNFIPFQYISFVPARIFVGGYAYNELPWLLLIQIIWIIIFYFIATIGFKHSLKNYEGVGA